MKPTKPLLTLSLITACLLVGLTAQSCSYFNKKEFAAVSAQDLTAWVEATLPDSQKRLMAQNDQQRKQMIQQFQQMFALAQAAVDQGLDKTEKFTHNLSLNHSQVVAQEFTRRNETFNPSKDEVENFVKAHQKEFDNDVKFFFRSSQQPPTPDQMEQLKAQWGDTMIRAEKGRQAGIDKEAGLQTRMKFMRANLLADLYAREMSQKTKPSADEINKYLQEHPEADLEKIRQRAEGLLQRLKSEKFEDIANQINDDGTRGTGGDLPWFWQDGTMDDGGQMDAEFSKAAFALQPGQTSGVVKSKFGFHIIKVEQRLKDKKRMTAPTPAPGAPTTPSPTPEASPAPAPTATEMEKIKSRHIYLSTSDADSIEQKLTDEKIKRVIEDATLKYKVTTPADFAIDTKGMRLPSGTPPPGGGTSGSMRQIDPNANK